MDFALDAIKAAHYSVSSMSPLKDPKGLPMNVNLDTFVFTKGSANSFTAQEILGAIRRGYKPQSAENDGSGIPSFKVIELPWITTNTAYWWAFDSSMVGPETGLQYKESQGIKLEGPNIVFTTKEIQLKSVAELKPSLINGENPAVGNAQQADYSAVATTKRDGLLKRVSNSLNTAYNLMKAVSWTEMFQPVPNIIVA
jgi:hypothetical protein